MRVMGTKEIEMRRRERIREIESGNERERYIRRERKNRRYR